MALARRNRGAEGFIWPGFVDGLATLLMVIIFILMVFFLIQVNLAHRLSGQDATLVQLRGEIGELGDLLNLERQRSGELAASNRDLALALDSASAEIARLSSQILGLEVSLAESEAAEDELKRQLAAAASRTEAAEEKSRQARRELARSRETVAEREAEIAELAGRQRRLEEAAAGSEEALGVSRREVEALTRSVAALREKLGQIEALLQEKEDEAREAKQVTENLTRRLNDALAGKVVDLQRFRSEFFGRLREILQDRDDLRIVGDRFVFQSEVLFELGSADIGADGEATLQDLSQALSEIAGRIPTDIDWVLQVSGHTDNLPIRTPRYRDNWDLSTQRAISVVRYLALSGLDPERLSAAGFGEYQPIGPNDTPAARARNRRIEFKLTRR